MIMERFPTKQIKGYELVECIGTGGYGAGLERLPGV